MSENSGMPAMGGGCIECGGTLAHGVVGYSTRFAQSIAAQWCKNADCVLHGIKMSPSTPSKLPRDSLRKTKILDFSIEMAASLLTVSGILLGSTTLQGGALYMASLLFWFILVWRKKLWGLLPLNIFTAVVITYNLIRASG